MPKRKAADFEKGLSVYVESIENDFTLNGLEKGVKISSARKEMKQYINQASCIIQSVKDECTTVQKGVNRKIPPCKIKKY